MEEDHSRCFFNRRGLSSVCHVSPLARCHHRLLHAEHCCAFACKALQRERHVAGITPSFTSPLLTRKDIPSTELRSKTVPRAQALTLILCCRLGRNGFIPRRVPIERNTGFTHRNSPAFRDSALAREYRVAKVSLAYTDHTQPARTLPFMVNNTEERSVQVKNVPNRL